jgi:hypothetical protein
MLKVKASSSIGDIYSFYKISDPFDTTGETMVDYWGDLTSVAEKVRELLASTPLDSISVVQVLDCDVSVLVSDV